MPNLVRYFTDKEDEMLHLLKKVGEHESPSTDKKVTDVLSEFLAGIFKDIDFDVNFIENNKYGKHVVAEHAWAQIDIRIALVSETDKNFKHH